MPDRAGDPAVELAGLSKSYGETPALVGIDLGIRAGEVHALLGGNGSGKSTLIKILAGVVAADAGTLTVSGTTSPLRAHSAVAARAAGMRFVHQGTPLFDNLTVAENLTIDVGFSTNRLGRIRWRELSRSSTEVLDRFGIEVDPSTPLRKLPPATRAMVAIARALADEGQSGDRILVLDEPTASLPAGEVDQLLAALRRWAAAGHAILYVTHRLPEVPRVADRVTVLKDGQVVGHLEREGVRHDALVDLLAGSEEGGPASAPRTDRGAPLLAATGLRHGPLKGLDLELHPGEIVGLAGIRSSGRSTALRMIFGDAPIDAGASLRLEGRECRFAGPRDAIEAGIAYLPEDRSQHAAFPQLSVQENLYLAHLGERFHRGRLDHREMRRGASEALRTYSIKAASAQSRLASLSGGNQQKVMLARWLMSKPSVLLLDEPTQGVDIAARHDIWALVRTAVSEGATALVVSSDFDELATVCDRVLVLREGVAAEELHPPSLTDAALTRATGAIEPGDYPESAAVSSAGSK